MSIQISVGDRLKQTEAFAEGFLSNVARSMRGRDIRVLRIFNVMAVFGDGKMLELEFEAPTNRHKTFKKSFALRDLDFYLARGELSKVDE